MKLYGYDLQFSSHLKIYFDDEDDYMAFWSFFFLHNLRRQDKRFMSLDKPIRLIPMSRFKILIDM
jgi:hypothetical protein